MNPESMLIVERLLKEFGFPVFVALCALLFFWQAWKFITTTSEKKDKAFLDYVEKRDQQMVQVVESHNRSFRENTLAINKLRHSVEKRMQIEEQQGEILKDVKEVINPNS